MNAIDAHYTGAAAELFAASLFTARGHQVFLPAFTQSKADFIADVDGKLMRVQVKCATKIHGGRYRQVRLGGSGRPLYEAGAIDLLAIVCDGRLRVMPFNEELRVKSSMSFKPDALEEYLW